VASRLVAARKHLADLEAHGDRPSPALATSEANASKLNGELETAREEAARAKTDFEAKAREVARLKELANQPAKPADLDQQLAAARAIREKARAANTNAVAHVDEKAKQASEAGKELTRLKASENRPAELAAARSAVERLVVAQAQAVLFKARDQMAARKREVAALQAAVKERQEEITKLTGELSAARDSATKSKLKAALKTAQTDAKNLATNLKRAEAEAAADQALVEKLARDYERQKSASREIAPQRADTASR